MEIDDASNPLIWTEWGYVREQDMQHTVEWLVQTKLKTPPRWKFWLMGVGYPVFAGIVLIDRYTLDGKVVKESRHIYKADGVMAQGETQELPK
jgi:hypothetical protein